MNIRIFFFLFLLLLSTLACRESKQKRPEDVNDMLTKERIIEIANRVVLSEGFRLDRLEVRYDVDNKEWKKVLNKLKQSEISLDFVKPHEALLKDRCYQSVHYIPDVNKVIAGEMFVFVDKETGEVITACGGI